MFKVNRVNIVMVTTAVLQKTAGWPAK